MSTQQFEIGETVYLWPDGQWRLTPPPEPEPFEVKMKSLISHIDRDKGIVTIETVLVED